MLENESLIFYYYFPKVLRLFSEIQTKGHEGMEIIFVLESSNSSVIIKTAYMRRKKRNAEKALRIGVVTQEKFIFLVQFCFALT
jgi:hypothetical protein